MQISKLQTLERTVSSEFYSAMYVHALLAVLLGVLQLSSACDIKAKGVNDAAKKAILKKHNELRAKVANGKQAGLPKASNMLEMEWDDQLAGTAQALADRCEFEHDDALDSNGEEVGQNLGWEEKSGDKADWNGIIQSWYDEVRFFDPKDVAKYDPPEDEDEEKTTGHFTQVIWAESNKVGCGFTRYRKDGQTEFLYACNYSPGGNVLTEPIYKVGKPCSGGSIPGLCKKH